jgi:hypothetical protein
MILLDITITGIGHHATLKVKQPYAAAIGGIRAMVPNAEGIPDATLRRHLREGKRITESVRDKDGRQVIMSWYSTRPKGGKRT